MTLSPNPAVRLPVGLATGIGCLPHVDPGDAVEFVLRHTPTLPAAPSLPARSRRESMIARAATGVAGVTVGDDGSLDLDHRALDPEAPIAPGFDTDAYTSMRAFLTAVADRTGPVKFSLTGPVTLGVALHAAGVEAPLAFRIAGRVVRQRARALTDEVLQRVPQAQLVVFVDEPGLVQLTEPGFPIGPNDGIDLVSGALAALEPLAITGLHCCGPADWRLALAAGPRILSLPVGAGAERHAGVLGDFLDDGGWLAWGAVPVDGPVGPTVDRLWRRLSDEFGELAAGGCDPALLRTHAMITPVCGLPHHGITQAEHVMTLANGLATLLHGQAIGLRLSVGA
ncbi:hypothetical protein [Rhabdothermincola salaria]|uniref:hypothetical protein n=1 Tax=Rhabdothermincola salaria TaxID=2903142 RepID=UPI001E540AB4|nr:hypothetical protein [Rhabdothermincola salaria]MCD9623734.1 hypothetical protein [Rhabdothermincola salaria]